MGKGSVLPANSDKSYEAESDWGTCERYAELKSSPKRMVSAIRMGRKKMAAMNSALGSMKGSKRKKGIKVKF